MLRRRIPWVLAASAIAVSFIAIAVNAAAVPAPSARPGASHRPAGAAVRSIAIVGDSLAATLAPGLQQEGRRQGISVVDASVIGCGILRGTPTNEDMVPFPWVGDCNRAVAGRLDGLHAARPDLVLWLSSWDAADRLVDGTPIRFGTAAGDDALLHLIDEAARRITVDGAGLVFLTVPHRTSKAGLEADFVDTRYSVLPESDDEARSIDRLNGLLRRYVRQHPNRASVIDLEGIVCRSRTPCPFQVAGVQLRPLDGRHFAGAGPAWIATRVLRRALEG